MDNPTTPRSVAVTVPCYQEETSIASVVASFRKELPDAKIYVFDNNCTDRTAEYARAAGAIVVREKRQGKGHVVSTIFETVDADVIVMVDGDGTYDATAVHRLIAPVLRGDADMTAAARLTQFQGNSFRKFHVAGNQMVCWIINVIFRAKLSDIFSGYRAFSRECALNIPITSHGFDVETEMTVQALYRGMVIHEIEAPYGERQKGSASKLKTIPDGIRVLLRLFLLLRAYKPLTLFGTLAVLFALIAIGTGVPPLILQLRGTPASTPVLVTVTTIAAMLGAVSLALGLILSSINHRLLELERVTVKRMSLNRSRL